MCRGVVAGEHVDDERVDGATQPLGQLRQLFACVAVTHPDGCVCWQWRDATHQLDQFALEFEHLLARTGAGGFDVAGQRHGSGTEVHCGE